jgi:hypothetical protein
MEPYPVINLIYEVYKQITDLNSRLTKRWRYSLCVSLENSILFCLELLILAKNAPKPLKAPYLYKADAQLEIIRFKLRLLLELKLANETRIFQLQSQMQEIGRQVGGWLKSAQNM